MKTLNMLNMFKIELLTKLWMEKHHMRLGVVTSQVFLISGSLAQRLGLGFLPRRERPYNLK